MIEELDAAVSTAKLHWADLQRKLSAQQRLLDGAAAKTQQLQNEISARDEEIQRLDTLSKLLTGQRDKAVYESGRTSQALTRSEAEVRTMGDDIRRLDHQVENLRNTMGLVEGEHAA